MMILPTKGKRYVTFIPTPSGHGTEPGTLQEVHKIADEWKSGKSKETLLIFLGKK
jgi:hypothetical protein